MSESITERAKNIYSVSKSTTYPDMTSSRYIRHTMGELLAAHIASTAREAVLREAINNHLAVIDNFPNATRSLPQLEQSIDALRILAP